MSSRRRRAREIALKALYQIDLVGAAAEDALRDMLADEVLLPAYESFARDFLTDCGAGEAQESEQDSCARSFSNELVLAPGKLRQVDFYREALSEGVARFEIKVPAAEAAYPRLMQRCLEKSDSLKDIEEFARRLTMVTAEKKQEIDAVLGKYADNWSLDRMARLDRTILRFATAEILFFRDVPANVTINEAIELAKKFSTERSCEFVNGILDKIFRETKPEKDEGRQRKGPPTS